MILPRLLVPGDSRPPRRTLMRIGIAWIPAQIMLSGCRNKARRDGVENGLRRTGSDRSLEAIGTMPRWYKPLFMACLEVSRTGDTPSDGSRAGVMSLVFAHVPKHFRRCFAEGLRVLVPLAALLFLPSFALADQRVALVIGNGAYRSGIPTLTHPPVDAAAISAKLRNLGFDVVLLQDASRVEMERSIRSFASRSSQADVALFFYAGHGIQIDGRNYLLPVDTGEVPWSRIGGDGVLEGLLGELVSVDEVSRELVAVKHLRIIVLDACRNNPFVAGPQDSRKRAAVLNIPGLATPRVAQIGTGKGLATPLDRGNAMVALATAPNTTADDGGESVDSPYTTALLDHLADANTDIRIMFGRVHDEVLGNTDRRQNPATFDSLTGDEFFFFNDPKARKTREPLGLGSAKLGMSFKSFVATVPVGQDGHGNTLRFFFKDRLFSQYASQDLFPLINLDEVTSADRVSYNSRIDYGDRWKTTTAYYFAANALVKIGSTAIYEGRGDVEGCRSATNTALLDLGKRYDEFRQTSGATNLAILNGQAQGFISWRTSRVVTGGAVELIGALDLRQPANPICTITTYLALLDYMLYPPGAKR